MKIKLKEKQIPQWPTAGVGSSLMHSNHTGGGIVPGTICYQHIVHLTHGQPRKICHSNNQCLQGHIPRWHKSEKSY
jgi:hypothetical protein